MEKRNDEQERYDKRNFGPSIKWLVSARIADFLKFWLIRICTVGTKRYKIIYRTVLPECRDIPNNNYLIY